LRKLGINCPEPIAYIEERDFLFTYGYFIYLKCNDPFVYPQLVEKKNFDRDLADAVAGYLAEIHAKGVIHGDMNLTNILYRKDADHYDFTVIDVNRCKFKRKLKKSDCYKDLRRVAHRRDLYEYIISKYARLRGWSAGKAVVKALKYLDEFEAKETVKGAWKDMKKRRQTKS
jgi:tRNA A-37 threonylcarbamoyl transferase component Bud32